MRNFAVVGAGRWGKNHVKTYNELGVLGAVVELDPNLRQNIELDYPGVDVSGDLDALIANKEITGVSVATPAETHFAVRRGFLKVENTFSSKSR